MPVDQRNDSIVWTPPSGRRSVRMSTAAIERLTVEVMRGFGATRRRGTETGGILLGHIDSGTVTIEDFEIVPCSYAFGPSYVLSAEDEEQFREAIDLWRAGPGKSKYAVGYFRSHTRDGLNLDDADGRLVAKYLREEHVALVIKPFATQPCRASFFLPFDSDFDADATADEFPFTKDPTPDLELEVHRRHPLVPRTAEPAAARVRAPVPPPPDPVSLPEPEPEPNPEPARELAADPDSAVGSVEPAMPAGVPAHTRPQEPEVHISSDAERLLAGVLGPRIPPEAHRTLYDAPGFTRTRASAGARIWRVFAWTAFSAALLAFGAAVGFQYAGGQTPPILLNITQAAPSPPPPPNPYTLGLSVERQGSGLVLRWNRAAMVIESAERGMLLVSEKDRSKEVNLGYAELRNGTVIYRHVAPEIRFRLELVLGQNRAFSETITWTGK